MAADFAADKREAEDAAVGSGRAMDSSTGYGMAEG